MMAAIEPAVQLDQQPASGQAAGTASLRTVEPMATASVRTRRLFSQFIKLRNVPAHELPDYQTQAREQLERYGNDYTEQWLQGWLYDAQADAKAMAERLAASAARAEALTPPPSGI